MTHEGWREFAQANGWVVSDGGELRLVEVGDAPEYAFKRWIAIFPAGGWRGMAFGEGVQERPEIGFRAGMRT